MDSWPLLGRLKKAVKKVRYLLNLNATRWRLASMIGRVSRRRLSFNDRPGLIACVDDYDDTISYEDPVSTPGSARLQRTISYPSEEEDVDRRAEMFIANFYRQLKVERQISLELKYCSRGNSFNSIKSP